MNCPVFFRPSQVCVSALVWCILTLPESGSQGPPPAPGLLSGSFQLFLPVLLVLLLQLLEFCFLLLTRPAHWMILIFHFMNFFLINNTFSHHLLTCSRLFHSPFISSSRCWSIASLSCCLGLRISPFSRSLWVFLP